MQNITKRLSLWAILVAFLLTIPLIAMQFTADVVWTGSDFVFAAVVLFGSALIYELVSRTRGNTSYKWAVAIGVLASLLLVWANGAVGLIGNEENPLNLLYGFVLVVGIIGATMARLRPRGMSNTLFAMAVVHILVPAAAYIFFVSSGQDLTYAGGIKDPFRLIGIAGFFAMLFVVSGLLFRHSEEATKTT